MRMILLVLVFILLAVTAFLYFKSSQFDFLTLVAAIGCLVIYLVTKPRQN